jgi:hypothetical protein
MVLFSRQAKVHTISVSNIAPVMFLLCSMFLVHVPMTTQPNAAAATRLHMHPRIYPIPPHCDTSRAAMRPLVPLTIDD